MSLPRQDVTGLLSKFIQTLADAIGHSQPGLDDGLLRAVREIPDATPAGAVVFPVGDDELTVRTINQIKKIAVFVIGELRSLVPEFSGITAADAEGFVED